MASTTHLPSLVVPVSGLAAASQAAPSAETPLKTHVVSAAQDVISNNPIMDIRTLPSFPAYLGQNTDAAA